MCGIIAVLRRKSRRQAPDAGLLVSTFATAEHALAKGHDHASLAAAAINTREMSWTAPCVGKLSQFQKEE